jgi:5'(3')-deoxyribonucleotidase
MDGVMCDFDKGVEDKFGVDQSNHTEWSYDYEGDFNLTRDQFWTMLDNVEFWRDLKPCPWFEELKALTEPYKPFVISHTMLDYGMSGKLMWLKKHFPSVVEGHRFLIGQGKHIASKKGRLLIDDNDGFCRAWEKRGGKAILFPQPWNLNRNIGRDIDKMHYVTSLFNFYKGSI